MVLNVSLNEVHQYSLQNIFEMIKSIATSTRAFLKYYLCSKTGIFTCLGLHVGIILGFELAIIEVTLFYMYLFHLFFVSNKKGRIYFHVM